MGHVCRSFTGSPSAGIQGERCSPPWRLRACWEEASHPPPRLGSDLVSSPRQPGCSSGLQHGEHVASACSPHKAVQGQSGLRGLIPEAPCASDWLLEVETQGLPTRTFLGALWIAT